ncbi:MAG: hypothetical protein V4596_10595 [Bdellovibrionota bacterium]
MNSINKKMSIKDFAFYVASQLKKDNIDVILTGGAVVSIYTEGKVNIKDDLMPLNRSTI